MSKDRTFDTGKSREMRRNEEAAKRSEQKHGKGESSQHIARKAGSGGRTDERDEKRQ